MSKIFEALQKAEQEQDPGSGRSHELEELSSLEQDLSSELVVVGRPGSAAAEQFRFLRSNIIRPLGGEVPKTLLVTSALQREGKTFTACNLAVTIAQGLDEHVLLVDADLRNPRVHRLFGITDAYQGLSTYLLHGKPLSELLCKTGIPKLTLLPAGQEAENPAEILSSTRMKNFIAEVRDRYPDRLVIFDSPPVQLAPETIVIGNEVDGFLLLVYRGYTPRDAVQNALERFKQEKLKGVIFNGFEKHGITYRKYMKKGYQYTYDYGYSYKQKQEGGKLRK